MASMLAAVLHDFNDLRLEQIPRPVAEKNGTVLVRIKSCGVCATDLEMINGWDRTSFPAIPGHEWSGRVDAVGPDGGSQWIGRPCVAENVFPDNGEVGFEHPGGYAEYFITEADNLHFLPKDVPLQTAVLIEPLAVAVRAFRRLKLTDPSAALIIGDGPIGLLMALILRQAGVASLSLVGGRPARLAMAEKFGVNNTFNYHDFQGSPTSAMGNVPGRSFPCIIEASGSASALDACPDLASRGGKILIVGDYGDARAGFKWNRILHQELEIIGSNASADAWPEAVRRASQWIAE